MSKRQDKYNKTLEEILENPQKFTEEAQKREKKNKTYLKALNIIFGLLFIVSTVLLIVFLILDSEITPTILQYAGGVCAVSFLGLLYGLIDRLENVNFISATHPAFCTAKFRYRGEDYSVALEYLENNEVRVSYPEKVKAVTPGQFCVFYLGEECLGSGVIKEVYKNGEKLWYLGE